jgi:hypothetical protein
MWLDTTTYCLSRLADSALATDITGLIRDRTLSDDLRIEMLQIVRDGRLVACLDDDRQIACGQGRKVLLDL